MRDSKRDTDVKNKLLDSVGEGIAAATGGPGGATFFGEVPECHLAFYGCA